MKIESVIGNLQVYKTLFCDRSMIKRDIERQLLDAAKETPVIALLGPRQSGKTTIAKYAFPHHAYVNLEDLEQRAQALADPKGFLKDKPNESGIILDEVQHVPDLFSYIQVRADELQRDGYFILTGSQNFTLHSGISQSLAGRVSELTLLPLSINELAQAKLLPETIEEFVFKGSYPKLYARDVSIQRLYSNYIDTYIEKDVRNITNIKNIVQFKKFIKSCAVRSGQLLNLSSIGEDLGIPHSTVREWLSLLISSYIVFLLEPYHMKIPKRLVKTPKLFFFDTGIICSLLGLKSAQEVADSYLRVNLIETCIISDLYKQYCNLEYNPENLYFWRTSDGKEIDAIIDKHPQPIALEVKAGKTVNPDFFKYINQWNEITKRAQQSSYIIYGGDEIQNWPMAKVVSWKSSGTIIKDVFNSFEK